MRKKKSLLNQALEFFILLSNLSYLYAAHLRTAPNIYNKTEVESASGK